MSELSADELRTRLGRFLSMEEGLDFCRSSTDRLGREQFHLRKNSIPS